MMKKISKPCYYCGKLINEDTVFEHLIRHKTKKIGKRIVPLLDEKGKRQFFVKCTGQKV